MKDNWKIPYLRGKPQWYDGAWYDGVEWRDNTTFQAKLQYQTYERGRSAAHMVFADERGQTYHVFLTDFDDILHDCGYPPDGINGIWTFTKRGQNYGVKLVERLGADG